MGRLCCAPTIKVHGSKQKSGGQEPEAGKGWTEPVWSGLDRTTAPLADSICGCLCMTYTNQLW